MFMVVTALIVTGLAAWSANDIKNLAQLKNTRSALFAADSAVNVAITNIRYTYPTSATPGFCPNSGSQASTSPYTINNVSIDVWCVYNVINSGQSPNSRVVTLSAYPSTDYCGSTLCNGADQPYLQAQVWFNDFAQINGSNANNCQPSQAQTTCGTGMIVYSWVVQQGLT
jgi:hypothetical protein